MADDPPLVLDVDGTFLSTDLLYETLWSALGRAPLATLRALAGYRGDRADIKARLARLGPVRVDLLPVRAEVAALARAAQDGGRRVCLASGSHRTLVEGLARAHGLTGEVFASDGATNCKGPEKARALVAAFGARGFDYAGNEVVDRAVWDSADRVIAVGEGARLRAAARDTGRPVTFLPGRWRWADLGRALRPHQWVKNVLLLFPMIAAHDFTLQTLGLILLAMATFSAAASSIYLVNDLLDLEADRLHPTKRHRPLASGRVPISAAMIA